MSKIIVTLALLLSAASAFTPKAASPQFYRFTCNYSHLDTRGNLAKRERLTADYTRQLPGNRMRWTNVTAAETAGSSDAFGPGQKRGFMEGFSYTAADVTKMLTPEFFRGFPITAMQERNLVWDTAMFEEFAGVQFTNLKPNVPYHVPQTASLSLGGAGAFKHKDLQLTYSGVTRQNGEQYAIIDYRAFLNSLEVVMPGMKLVGRSHYWGQLLVSLRTRHIEHATLYEDVLGELTLQGQDAPRTINVFRSGVFERLEK